MINTVIGIHLCTRTSKKSEEVLKGLEWPIEVAWMQGCNGKGGPWSLEDFPREDVPCPCGDPTHWLIKYDYLEEID